MVAMLSPAVHRTYLQSPVLTKDVPSVAFIKLERSMDDFQSEVEALFSTSLSPARMLAMSGRLQGEFRQKLKKSETRMLPSYHHTLPNGRERGNFLALDVGGSNFRVALVDLAASDTTTNNGMHIRRSRTFPISPMVRSLKGPDFFDWMASKIQEMLHEDGYRADKNSVPLPMGLAWSFPFEQNSTRSGSLMTMGKGFSAIFGCQGKDLCELVMQPCRDRGLNVQMQTIVNDSTATLLSQAYRDPTTRISLILGTGTNSSIHLPVSALSMIKYGDRSQKWHATAEHVLVNTELSMFGADIFPITRWDSQLNAEHGMPDFQPFEYKVSGRYLGEMVRLVLTEAIREVGLFDGETPSRLSEPYALETRVIAAFEDDQTSTLSQAGRTMQAAHHLSRPLRTSELHFIRAVARAVSSRAAAYIATAVHALWALRKTCAPDDLPSASHVTIGCDGTVLEKYPAFGSRTQQYLDELLVLSGAERRSVTLVIAPESSVFGAAVAVACLLEEEMT